MNPDPEELPNLVIAGVHKAGTTSLYTYLAKHPTICASHRKEIGFFLPLAYGRDLSSLEEYAAHFRHCRSERYRMEASPSYFYGKETVANAIERTMPGCRIIVILRDPTDRLISYFNRAVSKGTLPEDINFGDFIDESREQIESARHSVHARAVREGMYIDYIRYWQEVFGDRLRILFFDDLERDAMKLTIGVCEWLGLDTGVFQPSHFTVENKTTQYRFRGLHLRVKDWYMKSEQFWRRHHGLKKALRGMYNRINADRVRKLQSIDGDSTARLRDFYEPYNIALRNYLEGEGYHDFPSWLEIARKRAAAGV